MENHLTKEKLAEILNNREYRSEITQEEQKLAKDSGLVVVFGASDDLMEFCGAIYDEHSCFEGGVALLNKNADISFFRKANGNCALESGYFFYIKALWCKEEKYSWTYESNIPHSTFEIVEDGEPYCRGIIFSLTDLSRLIPVMLPKDDPILADYLDSIGYKDAAATLRKS